jgi:Xaa-Pro dipeptidase
MNKKYIERLIKSMSRKNLDAMLIIPSEELNFIAGFSPYLCERFQGLFVKNNGDYFYFCNLLSRDEVEEKLGADKVFTWFDNEFFTVKLKAVLESKNMIGSCIGVNSTARAFNILDIMNDIDVKFVNGKDVLEEIRIIKSEKEIDCLKKAAKITDQVMGEIFKYIKPKMTEQQIAQKIFTLFEEKGMIPDFAIVASGPNAASPHHTVGKREIQENDVIILDIGGTYEGLFSDMTRTVFVGQPSKKQIDAYNTVLESNLVGIDAVKKGIPAKAIDKAGREIIENKNYGEYFINRLGHGLGYSVHEAPYINGYNEIEIDNGMVFSIEPGIYIKDEFGIRIEDIIIVEDGKGNPINHFTKEMVII